MMHWLLADGAQDCDVVEAWFGHLPESDVNKIHVLTGWLQADDVHKSLVFTWPPVHDADRPLNGVRQHVVKWLYNMGDKCSRRMSGGTAALAVTILDLYMRTLPSSVSVRRVFAVSAAVLVIASKMLDLQPWHMSDIVGCFTKSGCKVPLSRREVCAAEHDIGNSLRWRLHIPTMYSYVSLLSTFLGSLAEDPPPPPMEITSYDRLVALDDQLRLWSPFQLAVSVVMLQRIHFGVAHVWPDAMAVFTSCGTRDQALILCMVPLPTTCLASLCMAAQRACCPNVPPLDVVASYISGIVS